MDSDSLARLNALGQDEFTEALGSVFEHTPAIARQSWRDRPFTSVEALHRAMVAAMAALPEDAQLALIRAHPDLGSRTAMAPASVQEQAGIGLDQLSAAEYQQFQALNEAYRDRFDFPFIVAVKEHTKASILAAFQRRLTHDQDAERQTALAEIAKIAWFRLGEFRCQPPLES